MGAKLRGAGAGDVHVAGVVESGSSSGPTGGAGAAASGTHAGSPEDVVTQAIEIEVKPDCHDEIEAWFGRIQATVRKYPGYLSTTVIRPTHP